MARQLGLWCMMLAVAATASATASPANISGQVTNSQGVPQMGAVVVIASLGGSERPTQVYTDARGYYSAAQLAPGVYQVKVSAPSFLPSLRENVSLRAGAQVVVNLTLNTLFEALQLVPARRSADPEDDEWKWTLRSSANRPILRLLEDGPLVVVNRENGTDRVLKARVSFMAGAEAEGFGSSSDMSTGFQVEQSLFRTGTLSFRGNLGFGEGDPTGVVRAAYSQEMPTGSRPEIAFTAHRFATPESALRGAALSAVSLSVTDGFTLMDTFEVRFGGELQAVNFMGRTQAPFRPFGSVTAHLAPNTVVEYRYATSQPNTRREKGFDSAPADLTESGPRLTLNGSSPVLERARHQEISISQRMGKTSVQVAMFSDSIDNTALTGVGKVSAASGMLLPDIYSGTFSYSGGDFNSRGARLVIEQKLWDEFTAALDYAYGGTLSSRFAQLAAWEDVVAGLEESGHHTLAAKFKGLVPRAKTRWIASYRWTSGDALMPVDAFNTSAGQADPYLNVFIRQPLPRTSLLPGRMEALVDVRNLLAEGYVPVVAPDGSAVYLVQAARSVRGGVAFTF